MFKGGELRQSGMERRRCASARVGDEQPEPRGRRSASPSGAVATAALLWLSLWSESAARVPEAELKPPCSPGQGCPAGRRCGQGGQGG